MQQVRLLMLPYHAYSPTIDFIVLARTVDLPDLNRILPSAFYALCIPHSTTSSHTSHISHTLSLADLARFLSGSSALHNLTLELALDPLSSVLLPSTNIRIQLCSAQCTHAAERIWRTTLARGAADLWGLSLVRTLIDIGQGEVPHRARQDLDTVCQDCAFRCESTAWIRVRELKRRIPRLFDL